jgi:PAS domain S-box-containing protein
MTSLFFLISISLVIFILLVLVLLNLLHRDRSSVQARFAALCLTLAGTAAAYTAPRFVPEVNPLMGEMVFALLCWTAALTYLSFLVDMTAIRRSRYFNLSYAAIPPVALASVFISRPAGLALLVIPGIAVVVYYSMNFLRIWIRNATDDRARRDGEWMFILIFFFTFGTIVSFFHSVSGLFWVLAFWMVVIHFSVNHLGIFRNLTNTENKLILDNVFDIVIIVDSQGSIVRMNRRGYHVTQFSSIALIGHGVEMLVIHRDLSPRNRVEWLEEHAWHDTGGQNRRSPSIDAILATRSGEEVPVDLRVVCLVDLSHETTGYIISATDMRITQQLIKEISDREYAARDLALSESKFSRLFVFNPTGILILDMDTLRITDVNPVMENILEMETSMLEGRTLGDTGLDFADMSREDFSERIRQEGSVSEFSAQITFENQRVKKCRLSAVAFDLNDSRRIMLSASDITAEEEMREALMRRQKVETVGILAGGIAHDFNNILAVILGHIGLAKMRITDKQARDPVERAEQACLRAREITGQLLAFSRGGAPVLGIHDTRELVTEFSMLAVDGTSVACLYNFEPGLPPLHVDRIQIGQVLTNLVKNGAQAMDNSGFIDIACTVCDYRSRSARARPNGLDSKPVKRGLYVQIAIHDRGCGIPEAIVKKIFDPFFSTKQTGSGLGLSIVYSVIQNHGGALEVQSEPHKGTTFTLLLPAMDEEPSSALPEIPAAPDGEFRILVMDDDEQVIATAVSLLASFGYAVDIAKDGQEACEKYAAAFESDTPYDAAILDLVVPEGMSGQECAAAILTKDPAAVLIVSSGYSDDPVLAHWKEHGFKGALKKPYTVDEMRRALLNVLVL